MTTDDDDDDDADADEGPLLGLATTRQLLLELAARFEIPTPRPLDHELIRRILGRVPEDVLQYRTVGAWDAMDGEG